MASFGERLRELRQNAGLTQEQLADQSGVSIWNVRNYEQSYREPYWRVVPKLAKALGVDCTAFADCEDVQAEEPAPAPKRAPKAGGGPAIRKKGTGKRK